MSMDSGSDSPDPVHASDWTIDVPFPTWKPSNVHRLMSRTGVIRFGDGCVELVVTFLDGETTLSYALVLPSRPELAWSERTRQLRTGGLVIPNGARVKVSKMGGMPAEAYKRHEGGVTDRSVACGEYVIKARSIVLAGQDRRNRKSSDTEDL